MILYVNGDSHAAGGEINNSYNMAQDDPDIHNDRGPHPGNLPDSFGYLLAEQLNCKLEIDARSGCSNDRIIRTTRDYLCTNKKDVFVLIGWSTFDRKEVIINGERLCFSPGMTNIDDPLVFGVKNLTTVKHNRTAVEEYKKYIMSLDRETVNNNTKRWHKKIFEFHQELTDQGIPHLFFNTYGFFDQPDQPQYNWNNCFIGAYNQQDVYWHWLQSQGFNTVNGGYHYGAAAHRAWTNRLHNWLTDHQLI